MQEKTCLYHLFEGTNKEMSVISEYECIRLFKKHSGGKREPFSLFERTFVLLSTLEITLLQELCTVYLNHVF